MNFSWLMNLFFPPKCVFCKKLLEINVSNYVCKKCELQLKYIQTLFCCKICGVPMATYNKNTLCRNCDNHARSFKKNVSALRYEGVVRDSILRYKKCGVSTYARVYSKIMCNSIIANYSNVKFDLVLSSPSCNRTILERGFDHIRPIAKLIAQNIGVPYIENCIIKTRNTSKQTFLNYQARKINLEGAYFVVAPEFLLKKNILLIDDVFTTGATMNELSKTLKKASSTEIYGATLAITSKVD